MDGLEEIWKESKDEKNQSPQDQTLEERKAEVVISWQKKKYLQYL